MNDTPIFNNVLLVEDDESHALLIKRALKDFANSILHSSTVVEALAILESTEPDLIVSDLRLPDSSGVKHIENFKNAAPASPLIVLTSSSSLTDAVEALKLGARDFIVKNFGSDFKDILTLSLSRLFASLEIEKEKRRLLEDLNILRRAIENSNDALGVINEKLEVQYCNNSFGNFLRENCKSESLLLFSESVSEWERLQANLCEKLKSLSQGAVWSTELEVLQEQKTYYEMSLSVIQRRANGSSEAVLWLRETTERRQREELQKEILQTTTHDLKGPLGAIRISGELLEGKLAKGSREFEISGRIVSSAQGMLNLIEEFLSARRIQEGTLVLKPILQDLPALIGEVAADYESIAKAKKVEFVLDFEPASFNAKVEQAGFGRLLGNLLSNALKFTREGGRVTLSARKETDSVHIAVRDTGCGMEASEVSRIFEKFSRLEKHANISGSGLGLFVVKSIVAAYGGKVEVTSQPDIGSVFEIILPVEPPVNDRGELLSIVV